MSRSYNLRNRAGAGVATPSERALNESPSLIDIDVHSNEVAPQGEGPFPAAETTGTVRLYSDAVALRPPSPRREKPVNSHGNSVRLADAKEPERPSDEKSSREKDSQEGDEGGNEGDSSSKEAETPDKVEYSSWTTVKRRRARSEGSLQYKKPLTSEQTQAVKKAAEGLTSEQKQKILRRQEKVRSRRDSSESSRGEGPSRPKGKGIDPREWGNVNLSRESLNVEAQAAALRSYKDQSKATKESSKKRRHSRDKRVRSSHQDRDKGEKLHKHSSKKHKESRRPPEIRPAAQIAPRSYLGAALKTVGRHQGIRFPSKPSPSSSSSSSSSSSDSSYESSSESSTDYSEDDSWSGEESSGSYESKRSKGRDKRRKDNRHGRNHHKKRRSRSSVGKSSIKPIPPKEYDGAADVRAYHRFVRESDAYLRDGRVRGPRKVFLLSYYLTGKAYDFYTQKVSINEERWTVPQFYEELFNFCFPVDYRLQLRKSLARCHQNDKSVAEFSYELQDYFNMIGNIPEQDQVMKFWHSARPSIQKELWRNRLNPELSSWETVIAQAEIIEIAENVAERRDRRGGQAPQVSGSSTAHSKAKQATSDGSVRAVTFGSSSQRRDRKKDHRGRRSSNNAHGGHQKSGTPQPKEGAANNYHSNKGKSRGGSTPPKNDKYPPRRTPQLSDKEKAEYRAAGRCFNCGKEGHMSRNCPDNETIKSQGRGPPGASSFNVEPMPDTATGSDEDIEVLDSLPLGAMFFGDSEGMTRVIPWPIDEWKTHYPYWNDPDVLARGHIGDCYAMVVDTILTLEAPYPGDTRYDAPHLRPELRFHVKLLDRTRDYIIRDRLTGGRLVLARDLIDDPEFDVSYWYAQQRSRALGLMETITKNCCIGDAIAIVATKLLTDGIASSYPCTDPRLDPSERFYMRKVRDESNQEKYVIHDVDLDHRCDVPKSWLEDSKFDLVSWYRRYLHLRGFFEYKYYHNHQALYVRRPTGRTSDEPQESSAGPSHSHLSQKSSDDLDKDAEWEAIPELESLISVDDLFEERDSDEDVRVDDVPELEPHSDSDNSDNEGEEDPSQRYPFQESSDDVKICRRAEAVLMQCKPYPGDSTRISADPRYEEGDRRFIVEREDRSLFCVYDRFQGFETYIHVSKLRWDAFSLGKWFAERCALHSELDEPWARAHRWMSYSGSKWEETIMGPNPVPGHSDWVRNMEPEPVEEEETIDLGGDAQGLCLASLKPTFLFFYLKNACASTG